MTGISINQEYLELVPRPTKDQYASLKNSIKEDGLQVPIIINSDGVILDGHTRFQACKELRVKPKFVFKDFESPEKEREFVVTSNLARRHLNLFQRGEVCFNFYKKERDSRYQRMGQKITEINHGLREVMPEGREKQKMRLLYRFGKMIGVSASVTHYIVWLIDNADESTKDLLRTDKLSIRQAYMRLKNPVLKQYDRNQYLRHPNCLACGEKTKAATEKGCHVHTQFCCTMCGWGN